ncbi:iron ABC transporter permease [Enterococcus hirae]|nr:iron ABC transporter permease [Enterococcus hirae]
MHRLQKMTKPDKLICLVVSLLIGVFIFYPYLAVFVTALQGTTARIWKNFFTQEIEIFQHSLFVGVGTMVLSVIVAVSIALFFLFLSPKIQKVLRALLLLTMISPPFVTSLAYITLFGRRGIITHGLLQLTYNPYGAHGIIMMQTLGFASLNALILISLAQNINGSIIESGRALGANTNALVRDFYLPLMNKGIIVVAFLSFIRSLADFQTPTIIGGSYAVLASEGYLSVIAQGDNQRAAMINLLLAIPALLTFMIYIRYEKQVFVDNHGSAASFLRLRKKGSAFQMVRGISLIFSLLILLEYGSIFLSAVTRKQMGKLFFSLEPIKQTLPYLNEVVVRTVLLATTAAFFGSILSFLIVYYGQLKHSKWMRFVELVATIPYLLPGTFFGLGYLIAFSHPPLILTGTLLIVLLNMLFKQIAFATKAASSTLNQINPTYFNVVHDLGGGRLAEWRDVLLPLSRSGFLLVFMNGFISTMTTIGSIIFLVTPGKKVLTLVMFDVVQRGEYGIAAVLACVIMLICMIAAVLAARLAK